MGNQNKKNWSNYFTFGIRTCALKFEQIIEPQGYLNFTFYSFVPGMSDISWDGHRDWDWYNTIILTRSKLYYFHGSYSCGYDYSDGDVKPDIFEIIEIENIFYKNIEAFDLFYENVDYPLEYFSDKQSTLTCIFEIIFEILKLMFPKDFISDFDKSEAVSIEAIKLT